MQALLLLASYLHSVDTPTNPSRSQHSDIAMTTVGRFTASLVDVWATDYQASGDHHDSQAKVWDLRFLRWLLTLWVAVIGQHLLRTQILLAPLLPPVASKIPTRSNKSSTKDTRTESLLQFGVPAVEQTAQPVMDLAKPGPRFGSLLVGRTVPR